MSLKEEKWIGVAELRQRPGVQDLGPNRGGFVTVVLFARDRLEFEDRIRVTMAEMGFDVVKVDEVEPYDQRTSTYEVDQSLRTAADRLVPASDESVAFGRFHTFPLD
jgi:hypothetical protein